MPPAARSDDDRQYLASALLTNALEACLLAVGLERTEEIIGRLTVDHGLLPAEKEAKPTFAAEGSTPLDGGHRHQGPRVRWADAEDDSNAESAGGETD
jgi:hypothetical protein